MNDPTTNPPSQDNKPSFVQFLKDSGTPFGKPLAFLLEYFGPRTLLTFAAGVAATYVYAAVQGTPPFFPNSSAASREKLIHLDGIVHTIANKPLTEFNIGLVEKLAPVTSPTGAFQLEVPVRAQYNLIVSDPRAGTFYLFGNQLAEKKDVDRYALESPLSNFPMELGVVFGSAFDHNSTPIKGHIEVEGKSVKIDEDGTFKVANVPIGKTRIRIVPSDTSKAPWEQDVQMSTTGSTMVEFTSPN